MIHLLWISLVIFFGLLAWRRLARIQTWWLDALQWVAAGGAAVAAGGIVFSYLADGRLEFLHPWAFVFLLFPLAVLWVHVSVRNVFTRTLSYPLTHLRVVQTSLRVLLTRWLPVSLYTLALLFMTAALARPVRVDKAALPPTEGIDIVLLLDVSASMQKDDFYPNRFVAAQRTALNFIEQRITDRIGLVAFAKAALLQAPLTLDHEALEEYIRALYLGIVDATATAIGDGLAVATNHLKDSKAKSKVIILLTDGDSNAGAIDPRLAAKAAAAYGIRVYTIGTAAAPQAGSYTNQKDEINEGLLLEIATATGGKFYRAKDERELAHIYDTINELERTTFTADSSIHRTDVYHPLLLLALCLLAAGLVLEKLFLIKVP